MPSNIAALDSIRGLAALIVVVFHIPVWNSVLDVPFLRNGYLMVDLFFVLSGFVIFRAYGSNIHTIKDLVIFQGLRFGRLYPVHLVFLLVFLVIEAAKWIAQSRYGIASPNAPAFKDGLLGPLIQHLLLIQAIGPSGNPGSLNGPAWSISVEFYTYLVFGALILLSRRWALLTFAALHLLAVGCLLTGNTMGFGLLLQCWSGFFLGCLVARAVALPYQPSKGLVYVSLIALLAFLSLKRDSRLDPVVYFTTAAFLYCVLRAPTGAVGRLLETRPLIWLGTLSYSLYMSHYPIIWIFNQGIRIFLKRPEVMAAGYKTPALGVGEAIAAVSVLLIVVLMVSNFIYVRVERPFRQLSRRVLLGLTTQQLAKRSYMAAGLER